jgi:hypothetical protein
MIARKVAWVEKSCEGREQYRMSSRRRLHSNDLRGMAKPPMGAEKRRGWT